MQQYNQRIKIGERVTLFRRGKKGIWQMDFHWQGHRQISTRTANLKTAKQRVIRLEAQLLEGTYQPNQDTKPKAAESTSLSIAIENFTQYHQTEGTRPTTYVRYRGILYCFRDFVHSVGKRRVSDVDLSLVDRYRAFRKPNLSDTSMRNEGRLLKSFFNWCIELNLLPTNPLEKRKFTAPREKKKNILTLDDVNSILKTTSPIRMPVLAMLAFTGMRSGECRNLLVEDVDLENRWIYIQSRLGHETKSGEDWKVPIHPRLHNILAKLKVSKSGWFFTALPSTRYPGGDHHINTKRLNEDFKKVLGKLEMPQGRQNSGFTVHSLRHFFKTFCITNGIPKPVVDEWQGHDLRRKPSDQYFHLSDDESQRLMREVPFGE